MTRFTLEDLGMAYRKAKVDLFYSSHASPRAIVDYEENLHANLTALLNKINSRSQGWIKDKEFLGDWTVATKSIDMQQPEEAADSNLINSSPAQTWTQAVSAGAEKPNAVFRCMAACSLDFHVLSSLWLMKVGHQFDAKLGDCAYGNRLRRTKDEKSPNILSLGSFQRYLRPFCNWRDNGIKTMRSALGADKSVVALTADVSSFYHQLNPDFMLAPDFVRDVMGLELTGDDEKLHKLFIGALKEWAQNTPLKKGLPVGLAGAHVVANVALIELDRLIEKQVAPLYYGRYVDDIILVMENKAGFRSVSDVWEWLFARSDGKLGWAKEEGKSKVAFQPAYLAEGEQKSQIHFANSKNKVFLLKGESGKAMVAAIEHEIHERASEWRAMPVLPRSADKVATDLLVAAERSGEAADNLRKTDALSMRRASFAIKLRDFEAYERDLAPDAWKAHRVAFFRAVEDHVLVLPHFFELAIYLPRIVRLATVCQDFEALREMISAVCRLVQQTEDDCRLSLKGQLAEETLSDDEIAVRWRDQILHSIHDSIAAAMPFKLSGQGKQAWNEHMASLAEDPSIQSDLGWLASELQALHTRLFSSDLAHRPFRSIGLFRELAPHGGVPAKKTVNNCEQARDLVVDVIYEGTVLLANWIRLKRLPYGLLFATRPFNLTELYLINQKASQPANAQALELIIKACRGFELGHERPTTDKYGDLHVPVKETPPKVAIAVSSWKTSMGSWSAAVTRMPDPDIHRYARLCRLVNEVISNPYRSRYLILPELALPARWFLRIARKLQGRGISLISGVEYLHARKARVRNQVWAALTHNGLGFPTLMVYRQDKQRPALHEETELQRLAGRKLQPEMEWKQARPPVIAHGNFHFALLVCSQLTNIEYRAALRGKLDALFVPEWNQDLGSFNALVESAALDIHAYIVQCNDRQFGDSRIRAPYKDNWKRDLLRVKGGVTDYCVIGDINVQVLRRFQSSHRSPGKPFKPVPDGFRMSYDRKVLPAEENE